MINVRELRVGNLVLIKDGTEYENFIWVVSSVSEQGVQLKCEIGLASPEIENVYPIELTDAILLKCGFKSGKLEHGDLYFYWNSQTVSYGVLADNLNDILIDNSSIKYLHQLQNIYYALTGKELEVKL